MILLFLLIISSLSVLAQPVPKLVINEILFNPATDGYDYVEIYNNGTDSINLQNILLCNRNATKDISGCKSISKEPFWLRGDRYTVITANEKWVRQNYHTASDVKVCQASSMPAFGDDKGTVILFDRTDSLVIDELNYSEKWHFALINDPTGVALERIHPDRPTDDRNNWASSSSSSGYGTPGFRNAQYYDQRAEAVQGSLTLPKSFSPDNDGADDYVLLTINMSEPGYVVNSEVYDISGFKRCHILRNKLLGTDDKFRWDGVDDSGKRLPRGVYILYSKLFNMSGKIKKFKNVIVINYRSE